ncbi:MAG: outer membrane protein assembly factor BamD [Alphaproteobacteria bacterium]|nr:outer membrane protein assembly factor BamD [Alphaproteobacteria bacterium]
MKKILALGFMVMMLSSCATSEDVQVANSTETAEQLYHLGYKYLQKTSYDMAAQNFEKIELEHPYSKWAVKSKLMSAYAYYKGEKYDDAIMALERFIKFHPSNKDVAYAYYMRGLCYYDQITPAEKDQSITKKAQDAFTQLLVLFPDTEYAQDAKGKLNLILDHMAGQEMSIGRYYLKNQNYLSALNRFSVVVKNYQMTPQIEEALYRQVEIYTLLGMQNQALKAYKVLEYNYPKSKWLEKAKKIVQ